MSSKDPMESMSRNSIEFETQGVDQGCSFESWSFSTIRQEPIGRSLSIGRLQYEYALGVTEVEMRYDMVAPDL